MKDYSYIIDDCCHQARSRALARQIIPILIRWAKQGQTNKNYVDLIHELGYPHFSGIGRQLGNIDDIIKKLMDETGEKNIPTLNALCKLKSTGLPSDGFSYVYQNYKELTKSEKIIFINGLNLQAITYPNWDWVLTSLGLKPSLISNSDDENAIRFGKLYGSGGESIEHKKLKEYISQHPESIGIKTKNLGETEYTLLSGDRIDVYFEDIKVVIEVKPISSPDGDIMRGLYQCVKYKSVLDAEDKVHGYKPKSYCILVIGGSLSESNNKIKDTLDIDVIENFNIGA